MEAAGGAVQAHQVGGPGFCSRRLVLFRGWLGFEEAFAVFLHLLRDVCVGLWRGDVAAAAPFLRTRTAGELFRRQCMHDLRDDRDVVVVLRIQVDVREALSIRVE